jgi:regulator of sigma E protease
MGLSLLAFLLVIAICVVSHELGHLLAARTSGVQVHEFAFGMGPVLFSSKKEGMVWSIRTVPIGGFVRLAGMGEEQGEEEVLPGRSFLERSPWARLMILAGGSVSNIVLAILFTAILLWGHGVLDLGSTRIGEVMEGYPAEKIGLLPGDTIKEISGISIEDWGMLSSTIREIAAEGPIMLTFERNGVVHVLEVNIPLDPGHKVPLLGIRPSMTKYPFPRAVAGSLGYIWDFSIAIVKGIWTWAMGRGQVDITGPVGIASMAGEAARDGFWTFLAFLSMINLHLGILNLLPFPALDGGRILLVMGEIVTGKKLPPRLENLVHMAGFILLILLLIFVTWKDLARLLLPGR